VDTLIEKGEKKEIAIMQVIQKYIVDSKKVLFEGDGYSDEWEKEAAKRKLPNIKTTPLALDAFVTEKANILPVGLQIIGPQYGDYIVLLVAKKMEELVGSNIKLNPGIKKDVHFSSY